MTMMRRGFNLTPTFKALLGLAVLAGMSELPAAGAMRDISSLQMVREMKLGWNLGNTLDAPDGETTWGNPLTTKAMMDVLKAKGFNTVRIPVTWRNHLGPPPETTVDGEWMDRVEEIANYVLDNGMYAIVNTHHDEWITLYESDRQPVTERITRLWTQIATRFRDYPDRLFFETFNEPRLYGESTEWSGGTAQARSILNDYNEAAVNAIRATGGNNGERNIMIPTHAATALAAAQDDLKIPEPSHRIIVSQHTYFPYDFSLQDPGRSNWGSDRDRSECDAELDRIQAKFVNNGIPVIIGEWASIHKNNTDDRVVHAEYYTEGATKRGMLPIWWDNGDRKQGGLAILNRDANSWHFEEIADALVRGAENGGAQVRILPNDGYSAPDLRFQANGIRYFLPEAAPVALGVYTLQGKHVLSLAKTLQPAGAHRVEVPADQWSAGQYILRLKAGGREHTKLAPMTR